MEFDEDVFLNAFTLASIGMVLVSSEGAYMKVNKSICKILGYEEAELMSKTFQDITHPDDLDESLDAIKQMLTGAPDQEVTTIGKKLITHTIRHFHDEDKLFRKTKFPLADMHGRIHSSLAEDMNKLIENFQNGNASIGELFDFLAGRVVSEHMLTEDKKFFLYLSDQ
ncbi:bacteriohemerythrin [Desulfovibrio sp. UCD-KL4C]|uniref:bacteriohemerythrin n=1 Tax=Desulfovibrio sp. UCD-KL4C TaxID=2578120 RepID=UPI0025C6E2D1|nr:PAS domain S-box protein [Desulfovibrio sp. UCD-KL4C]